MNKSQKKHILKCIESDVRFDGRKKDEFRKIEIEYGVSSTAEGSARVKFGDCEVIAGVKLAMGTPFPDTPEEGVLMVNTEMLPLANPRFEAGPPSIESIEVARVTDRGIREGHMVNATDLCIEAGEKVWMINVDICPVNADGCLFTVASIAAQAAIKDAKYPMVVDGKVDYHQSTDDKLPVQNTPIGVTVHKFGKNLVIDPCEEELEASDARLTLTFVQSGEIVAMQKGGDVPFDIEEIDAIIDLAKAKSEELRALL